MHTSHSPRSPRPRPTVRRGLAALLLAAATAAATVLLGAALGAVPAAASTPVTPSASPPMGWNSWNKFGCNINETLIKGMADAIVANGLDQLGYRYVNIDDCWMASTRDSGGHLQPDPTRFPGGISGVASYVHGKGLKLGIYESAGTATCQGLPGSLGHETTDAASFASWGVDYLKYDNCNNQGQPAAARYKAMGDALKATGRAIVYSLCNWGQDSPWLFGPGTGGTLWRTTGDISDNWGSVTSLLDQQVGLELFSGPNAWNDPDMLEVGNGGMTSTEYTAHFSLWALLNAPLILGNDLRSVNSINLAIIKNADVVAVDQDWGGSQGRRVSQAGTQEVWAKPMSDGSVAVALFNRGTSTATVSTSAAEIGLAGSSSYSLKDLWSKATSSTSGSISASVPSHGVVMYRVTRAGSLTAGLAAGTYQLGDLAWTASTNFWGPAERNMSNGEQAAGDGHTITIGTATFAKGIGAHADSGVHAYLGGTCPSFSAKVGVDSEAGAHGTVRFAVYGDGRLLAYTETKAGGQGASTITVGTAGVRDLELRVGTDRDGTQYDHADWGDAKVTCTGTVAATRYPGNSSWTSSSNGWGPAERNQSNAEQAAGDGVVLRVGGVDFPKGIGAHAASDVALTVTGCTRFTATLGVDAETGGSGSVVFSLVADGTALYTSPTVTSGTPVAVDLAFSGRTTLHLVVSDGGDGINYDHADWAGAALAC